MWDCSGKAEQDLGGSSPRKGQEEGEHSVPSTGLSEEAPVRLFAEVTGRILSHRGELKRQLSAIAYWKTEEVVLFQGAAEDVPKHTCDAAFSRLGGVGRGSPVPLLSGRKGRREQAGSCVWVGAIPVLQAGKSLSPESPECRCGRRAAAPEAGRDGSSAALASQQWRLHSNRTDIKATLPLLASSGSGPGCQKDSESREMRGTQPCLRHGKQGGPRCGPESPELPQAGWPWLLPATRERPDLAGMRQRREIRGKEDGDLGRKGMNTG